MVRLKHRYLVCSIFHDGPKVAEISSKHIQSAVRDSIQANYGEFGAGAYGMVTMVKFYAPRLGLFLVRVPRENFREVWASMTFITSINRNPLTISVIHTSGSARTCKDALWQIIQERQPEITEDESQDTEIQRYSEQIASLDL